MTANQFTPGPWHVKRGDVMNSMETVMVARAWGPAGRAQETEKEHEANARLIAAAPDLLAALREVERRLDRWAKVGIERGPSGRDSDWPTLVTQICDAINRAEGRKQ
jgi:hypothetical protein